jgi:hypothetical protein
MDLDRQLQRAMRRETPAPGLARRVLERIERESVPPATFDRSAERPFTPRSWRALAASLLLTAFVGGWVAHEAAERRREEGERARDQVLVALRITGAKMRHVQQEVRDIGTNH